MLTYWPPDEVQPTLMVTLENLYFAQADRADVEGVGDAIKAELRDEGHRYVVDLLARGKYRRGL